MAVPLALLALAGCRHDTTPPGRTAEPATSTASGGCEQRTGGAVISVQVNDQRIRLWSANTAFIAHAKELQASGKPATAMFDQVLDGRDCDDQWTFHVEPSNMSWPALTIEGCDGRPSDIEHDKAHWIQDVRRWCPWSARILTVSER